jgi:D-beta-D-heptose 7-phosphate kinase/D-beta-D-heptose 1-phosphate adenosyltransferase
MLSLKDVFSHLKKVRVLLLGDFLLDVYTKGVVERISPEAPVPVLLAREITDAAGGAGNVALNLKALGADVFILGRIGNDDAGSRIEKILNEEGVLTNGLFIQKEFQTPLKNRFLAEGQQLMRSDYEIRLDIDSETEDRVIRFLHENLGSFDVIAVSDYGKGFLSKRILNTLMDLAKKFKKKVIVDPKGKDFSKYRGAYLVKPNLNEAYLASNLEKSSEINEVANLLFETTDAEYLLITRSEKGMALFTKGQSDFLNFPAQKKDVRDVTGAGDTALSMITFGVANKITFSEIIQLANIASSIAIEKIGCVAVTLSEVLKRMLEKDPKSKVFGEETSVFALEKLVEDASVLWMDLKKYSHITNAIYQEIKKAASDKGSSKLFVHLDPKKAEKDFIDLLASMWEVDFICLKEDLPLEVLEKVGFLTRI